LLRATGIALYCLPAWAEKDPARVEIFEKLAEAEERHAARWAPVLNQNVAGMPRYSPSFPVVAPGLWLSRRFGTDYILPFVSGIESRD
jgi:hypothetical protein